MFKYVCKRIGLLIVTFFVIVTICFSLIKLLENEVPLGMQAVVELARREALGYNKPIIEQYGIFLRNVITKWEWGYSWHINYMMPAQETITPRLPSTLLVNAYSIIFCIPVGIALGIWAAIKKNKITDHIISTSVMLFVSVPSFVYAFLMQYTLGFRLGFFPVIVSSLHDAGGSWFTRTMLHSMILPVLALSFGSIAGLARYTRAELTEALTSEYMLLARSKGLTRSRAISTHAMKNAMVPVLPYIFGIVLSVFSGSIIIEAIFAINGVGQLYIRSIHLRDYDVFVVTSAFYTIITLASYILVDLSYGFLDPRIRMGER